MNSTHNDASKDPVLERFKQGGIYIRKILSTKDELGSLRLNARILKEKNIHSAEELRSYFKQNRRHQIKRIENFKFRSATLIRKGLAIRTYKIAGFGVLIDPKAKSVLSVGHYKKNVNSVSINNTDVSLDRFNGVKDTGSPEKLLLKLEEIEDRRKGEEWDPFNRVFGDRVRPHSETLLSYNVDAILGIVIDHDTNIDEALKFQKRVEKRTHRKIYFYQYDESGQLTRIPENVIDEYKKTKNNPLKKSLDIYPQISPEVYKAIHESKNISCSLENNFPPSRRHPIEYRVQVKREASEYKAYFEKGYPVIGDNKNKYTAERKIFNYIVDNYQKRLFVNVNELLNDKNIADRLRIHFHSLEYMDNPKNHLVLSYQPMSSINHDCEKVLELMGYDPAQFKYKFLESYNKKEIRIQLAVLQALNPMVKALESLRDLPIEQSNKRRRTK